MKGSATVIGAPPEGSRGEFLLQGDNVRKQVSSAASDPTQAVKTKEEVILDQINQIYEQRTDKHEGDGLLLVARNLGCPLIAPRKRATVMIIGNHSSGKSSFINCIWCAHSSPPFEGYIDYSLRPVGVAVESKGFTLVTSGKQDRASIGGESTLEYFPDIAGISKFGKKFMDYLSISVSTSRSRNFSAVDFLDTPGLLDGDVIYPFPVNDIIEYLSDHVELILVFLDPHGQALTSRTMQVVKRLDELHSEKLRFFLTRIDEIPKPTDLIKVVTQTAQNLTSRLHQTLGFEIFTIYLPSCSSDSRFAETNQIDRLCEEIQQAAMKKVELNLERLRSDAQHLLALTEDKLETNVRVLARRARWQATRLFITGCLLLFVLFLGLSVFRRVSLLLPPQSLLSASSLGSTLRSVFDYLEAIESGLDVYLGVTAPKFYWSLLSIAARRSSAGSDDCDAPAVCGSPDPLHHAGGVPEASPVRPLSLTPPDRAHKERLERILRTRESLHKTFMDANLNFDS